jgi:hypothetical protein
MTVSMPLLRKLVETQIAERNYDRISDKPRRLLSLLGGTNGTRMGGCVIVGAVHATALR